MSPVRWIISALLVLLANAELRAQMTAEEFGKNRIQYRQFDWQYISSENFDVYYYDGRRDIAQDALNYLEGEFDRITDLIGYPPYFKTKVFLYNSLTDLRQSNVGLNQTVNTYGGQTEFIKPYVEIADEGSAEDFKQELLYRISDLMVNEMMFGGSLKDVFQSSVLLNLPDWFVKGASLYVAKGWSETMDDYIRQVIQTKKARHIASFTGEEAALVGQSVWNFIAERYGKSSIGNILNYTRVTRNEERSILITLGISFKRLISEWQTYYTQIQVEAGKSYVGISDSTTFSGNHRKTSRYTEVKLSPDGKNIAFAENDRGRYTIKVRSLDSQKEITILSGGSRVINQQVDYRLPLLSWADSHTLGVIGVRKGKFVFWLYDLSSQTKLPRELDRFNNILSMSFSGNGRLVVISGDLDGRNDLFLLSARRDRTRRLTNDVFDDLDPSFIPGTNSIVFSSNRTTDSLRDAPKAPFYELPGVYNLYVYDLDTTADRVAKITNAIGKNYAPIARSSDSYYFLSDQRGIVNLFHYSPSTGIYNQVTNFDTDIDDYDVNFQDGTLAMIATKRLNEDIHVLNNFNFDRQIFTPPTRRKEMEQVKAIRDKHKVEEQATHEGKNLTIKDLINRRLQEVQSAPSDTVELNLDSTRTTRTDSVPTAKLPADTIRLTNTSPTDTTQSVQEKKNEVVNTDNYVFEDEARKDDQPDSFLSRFKTKEQRRVMGPFPYESKFSADNLVTSAVIDPLRGLGFQIQTQMNDMLENYRFVGGIMSTIDLRSGDAYAEFQYLPDFIDFSARVDRKTIRWDEPYSDGNIYNYSLTRFQLGASIPIDERIRFSFKPFVAVARSVNQGSIDLPKAPPSEIPVNRFYAGARAELVYDNSITTGDNLIEGSRGKVSFLHYQGLSNAGNSFSEVTVDLRHYQKIYREIVFAVRGFGGSYFGQSAKQFLLGGMDNWAFSNTRLTGRTSEGQPNPLGAKKENQDLLFVQYVTNLRGFDYASLFGNNVLLFNAELRVPLIRALSNSKITSNFFRNLQFTAFYDIGTSWSGSSPFTSSRQSSVVRVVPDDTNTDSQYSGPFKIEIKEYLNPWLYSYGVGMRTVILGYYTKFDLAWPVENYQVKNPRFLLTLGFDF